MGVEIDVDGSFFTFPDGWHVEKFDEWNEQSKLTRRPFESKGCDLVAFGSGHLWLVEAKDYSYPGASVPDDLAEQVGLKVFHTLAILHAVAHWGDGVRREFSRNALRAQDANVCLAVELPDKGRRLLGVETPLANLKDKLKKVTRLLDVHHPVVSNSFVSGNVPWHIRRNPETRSIHADR
ncbi:cysteine--tRNA ligase [Arthrobacter pigmenti]